MVPTLSGLLCAPTLEASLLQLVAKTFPGLPTKARGSMSEEEAKMMNKNHADSSLARAQHKAEQLRMELANENDEEEEAEAAAVKRAARIASAAGMGDEDELYDLDRFDGGGGRGRGGGGGGGGGSANGDGDGEDDGDDSHLDEPYDPFSAGMTKAHKGPLGSFNRLFQELPDSEMRDHPRIVGQILVKFCKLPENVAMLPELMQGIALHLAPVLGLAFDDSDPLDLVRGAHILLFAYASTSQHWQMPLAPWRVDPVPPDRRFIHLMHHLASCEQRLGFRFLLYLKCRLDASGGDGANESLPSGSVVRPYMAYAVTFTETLSLEKKLAADLEAGQDDSIEYFASVVPFAFVQMPFATIGNDDILRLVVSRMDANQLCVLVGEVSLGDMDIFFFKDPATETYNPISDALKKTLEWETLEQMCIWSLLAAEASRHDGDTIVQLVISPVLKMIDPAQHAEALLGLMTLCARVPPQQAIVQNVLTLPSTYGRFPLCCILQWSLEFASTFAAVLHELIFKCAGDVPMLEKVVTGLNEYVQKRASHNGPDLDIFRADPLQSSLSGVLLSGLLVGWQARYKAVIAVLGLQQKLAPPLAVAGGSGGAAAAPGVVAAVGVHPNIGQQQQLG